MIRVQIWAIGLVVVLSILFLLGCTEKKSPSNSTKSKLVRTTTQETSEQKKNKQQSEKKVLKTEKDEDAIMAVNVPRGKISGVIIEPFVPKTPKEVEKICKDVIIKSKALRDKLVVNQPVRTEENTLAQMNEISIQLDSALPLSEFLANISPNKLIRTSAEKCQQELMKFVTDLSLDREVYDALSKVDPKGLDSLAARALDKILKDYRRSGVDKDDATRAKLKKINEEIVKVGQTFSRRIREDKRSIKVTPAELEGMPKDFIDAHPVDKNGKIELTTEYPDFFPVQNYAKSENVRKKLYKEFMARAYPENEKTLKELLKLRHEYATILGYSNWADYNAEDKMAKNEKTIADFITRVSKIARPRMEADIKEILERKKKDFPEASSVKVWDRFYYVKKIQEEKFGVDSQEVRKFFDYSKVKEGLLAINQRIFNVGFRRVKDIELWHEDIEAYDVLEDNVVKGRFYLDMHPREGKYGHAAMFNLVTGVTERQLPSAALVCNFPKPKDNGPALMEHGDVTTFFHEFGHLMHHLLGSGYKWANLSGIACEWDFVEAPSQLLEEWSWNKDVLSTFATHYESGETISPDLVKKMRDAEEFGKGVHVMRQLFYAGLSVAYHNQDPSDLNLVDILKSVQEKYNPYPYEEGTYIFANFGHLEGYSSMYYTYMWSLNLAKDLFTKFQEKGLMNPEIAKSYTHFIVGAGGSVDAIDMVRGFLGREPSFDAFEKYLQE